MLLRINSGAHWHGISLDLGKSAPIVVLGHHLGQDDIVIWSCIEHLAPRRVVKNEISS